MQGKPHKGLRRGICAIGGFVLVSAATFSPAADAAPAAPRPLVGQPGAEWDAATSSNILGLTAAEVTPAPTDVIGNLVLDLIEGLGLGNKVAEAELVTTDAVADSNGPVHTNPALRSFAQFATVGSVSVIGADPVPLLEFSQSAPPDNATPQEGAIPPIDLPGLANIELLPGEASARWAGDAACVAANTPVARAQTGVANLSALETVTLENAGQGAIDVTSTISLPANPGGPGRDPRSVVGTTTAQVASIDLAGGALKIGVGSVPTLTATATGLPDGASLDYSDPLLTVSANGGPPQNLVSGQDLLPLLIPVTDQVLKPILDIVAGAVGTTSLTVTTGIIPGTEEEAADGTHAAGQAALLHANLTLASIQIFDLDILPMSAEANAPLGGLDCGGNNPIDISKDASTPTVSPGDTFDYIVTVSNVSVPPCTLTDVTVTDDIEGPAGSTIVSTAPPAASATWPQVKWTGLGPIEPGQSIQLKITIKVPNTAKNGDTYSDHAATDGNCAGARTPTDRFDLPDIPKVVIGVMPRTGGGVDSTLMLLGVAAMLTAAVSLRRLRRTSN